MYHHWVAQTPEVCCLLVLKGRHWIQGQRVLSLEAVRKSVSGTQVGWLSLVLPG